MQHKAESWVRLAFIYYSLHAHNTNAENGSHLSSQWLGVLICSEKESFAYPGPKTQEEMKPLQSSRGNQAAS